MIYLFGFQYAVKIVIKKDKKKRHKELGLKNREK